MKKKRNKNTVKRARLLENGINSIRLLGFEFFAGKHKFEQYCRKHSQPARYIIAPYPHLSLYGTVGRKEAFIHCKELGDFIFEAKYQDGGGSVDEKMPYLWECFLASPVPNWIVWFDGHYFNDTSRGLACIDWLKTRTRICPIEKRILHIVRGNDEFVRLANAVFKQRTIPTAPTDDAMAAGDLFACMD